MVEIKKAFDAVTDTKFSSRTFSDSSNGIHPNAAGMKIIADYIISQMID